MKPSSQRSSDVRLLVDAPAELVPGKLYALGRALELDGRVSWAPAAATGYQPTNCYLLLDVGVAMIVDPGILWQEEHVVGQLRSLVPVNQELTIFLTRAEFDCVGTLGGIAEAFPIGKLYAGGTANPFDSFDFARLADVNMRAGRVELARLPAGYHIPIGEARDFEIVLPEVRLLATFWGYDSGTKTLFTSDSFVHGVVASRHDSRVIVDSGLDPTTVEDVRNHLHAKLGWLEVADQKARIRDHLSGIFESHEVEVIAPTHGCVLAGRATVRRHLDLMLRALA